MGKSTISMVIFNSYVSHYQVFLCWSQIFSTTDKLPMVNLGYTARKNITTNSMFTWLVNVAHLLIIKELSKYNILTFKLS